MTGAEAGAPVPAGIGTYNEKTLHASIKKYIEPDESKHEVKEGAFIADIKNAQGITEVQTRGFDKLRKKLAYFLKENSVTVVLPLPAEKWLIWVDKDTGEVTKQRKSPKKGSFYHAFYELYKIRMLLCEPNLRIRIMLIDLKEYRYLDGWSADKKKGSTRCERIPVAVRDELLIPCPGGFSSLLPEGMPERFCSADFAAAGGINRESATTALNVLHFTGAVKRTGRDKRGYLYEKA